MKYISIGNNCKTAESLIKKNLRQKSYPFDWIFSSLQVIEDCIYDKFNKFLDRTYLYDITPERCKHSYYQPLIRTESHIKHHKECSFCKYDDEYEWYFFNHHDLSNEETYNTYKRRCERFLNDIEKEECCLVYTNEKTNDKEELVQFYKRIFEEKKNIYVLGLIKGIQDEYKYKNLVIREFK